MRSSGAGDRQEWINSICAGAKCPSCLSDSSFVLGRSLLRAGGEGLYFNRHRVTWAGDFLRRDYLNTSTTYHRIISFGDDFLTSYPLIFKFPCQIETRLPTGYF